jgi:hypothetical protein
MVKTFRQFLEQKRLAEIALQPNDITTLIGQILPAQQPNNVNNVADTLAKKNPGLIGAIADSPAAKLVQSKIDAQKRKTQPQIQQQNVSIGSTPGVAI